MHVEDMRSCSRSIVGKYTINPTLMTHAGHRAYKKVDQRNRPCDLLLLLRTNNKNYSDYEFAKEEVTGQIKVC